MARYYFDVVAGDCLSPDEEGIELPDLNAVQRELALSIGGMAKDELRASVEVGTGLNMAVEVRTDSGLVMRARFSLDLELLQ